MNTPARLRPLSRLRVLAGALVLLTLLAGVAWLTEALRHPPAPERLPDLAEPTDPREGIVCPPQPPTDDEPVRARPDDLLDCPHTYDGHTVAYEGEAVGAVLRRSDGAWVQLNDDPYIGDLGPLPGQRDFAGGNAGIGVHLPGDLADRIRWVGNHGARGDLIRVVGTFHRSDALSGEVAVIRATSGEIVRPGEPIPHEPLRARRAVGILLGLAAIGLLATGRLRRRRH